MVKPKQLDLQEHMQRVFSVDDDPEEVENDLRYLEGLHDGIVYALQGRSKITAVPRRPGSVTTSVKGIPLASTVNTGNSATVSTTANSNTNVNVNVPGTTATAGVDNTTEVGVGVETSANDTTDSVRATQEQAMATEVPRGNEPAVASVKPVKSGPKVLSYPDLVALANSTQRPALKHHHSKSKITILNPSNQLNSISSIASVPGQEDQERFIIHDAGNTLGHDIVLEELNPNYDNEWDEASTASSIETFTLRERQDAINKTHPFGIRIWKPALYKKHRSVQRTAAEDIHETHFKKITWGVVLTNIIWCITCGVCLYILLNIAGILVLLLGCATKSAKDYASVFFELSGYLLWPFGKAVYLIHDENYLEEDRNEGISVPQFYRWVTQYSNKLFFHKATAAADAAAARESASSRLLGTNTGGRGTSVTGAGDQDDNTNRVLSIQPSYGSITQHANQANVTDIQGAGSPLNTGQRRYFGRGKWTIGRILFYIVFYLVIQPVMLLLSLITWLLVFTIPMSNILWNLLHHCRKHPLALGYKWVRNTSVNNQQLDMPAPQVRPVRTGGSAGSIASQREMRRIQQQQEAGTSGNLEDRNILLCTFRCAGSHYYKFTVDGTNVIVMNLIFMVFFTILDFFLLKEFWGLNIWLTSGTVIFILCLLSTIPLAFYIGQAVASISAQTSMGLGAVINAFFSTVVEIYLYCVALNQRKGLLVEGSIIGSILGAVLLLPGLSMCGGALNRKTQRYNPASAGVSSALLIFSMIVMFVPTIFYNIYGSYTITCPEPVGEMEVSLKSLGMTMTSSQCYFSRPPLKNDKLFKKVIQPMSISCAIVLFLAYVIGLWFTLRTHAVMIWQVPISDQGKEQGVDENYQTGDAAIGEGSEGGHDAPNWSRSKSTFILLFATVLYAVVAEILVNCVDTVLHDFPGLNQKFLGLTIFALIPNTTEFVNAISFAIHGNVALSMEIGSAYALQVCLLQIPVLVVFSVLNTWGMDPSRLVIREQMLALVFPSWDLIGCMASIFMFTYLYAEGKSNYFKGSMLILMYVIIVFGFYFQGIMRSVQV